MSRGGFSGGQLNVRSGSGSNFIRRSNSLNFDAPTLQWTDRAARALGQQYTNLSLGGSVSGPIVFDKAFYNVVVPARPARERSAHAAQHRSRPASRRPASPPTRWRGSSRIAQAQSIPLTSGGTPSSTAPRSGLAVRQLQLHAAQLEHAARRTTSSFNGNWNRQTPAANLTTELPAHSGDRTNWGAGVQRSHTAYLKQILLSETTLSVGGNRNYGTPYTLLPNGTRARELHLRRRHERRAHPRLRWQLEPQHEQQRTHDRAAEPALLVQPEQQASPQAEQRAAARRLRSGPDDQPARHLRLQLARRSRGEPAGVLHALAAHRVQSAGAVDRRARARRLVPAHAATCRSSTACVSTAIASTRRRRSTRTSSRLFGVAQRRHAEQALPQPAHRILVDVRHRAADRRLRGRRAQSARRRARRHRRLPEHAERESRRRARSTTPDSRPRCSS